MSLFYAKLLLVLLLCIPVAVLGMFLLERLMDQALTQARQEKGNHMERTKVSNIKKSYGRATASRRTSQRSQRQQRRR